MQLAFWDHNGSSIQGCAIWFLCVWYSLVCAFFSALGPFFFFLHYSLPHYYHKHSNRQTVWVWLLIRLDYQLPDGEWAWFVWLYVCVWWWFFFFLGGGGSMLFKTLLYKKTRSLHRHKQIFVPIVCTNSAMYRVSLAQLDWSWQTPQWTPTPHLQPLFVDSSKRFEST